MAAPGSHPKNGFLVAILLITVSALFSFAVYIWTRSYQQEIAFSDAETKRAGTLSAISNRLETYSNLMYTIQALYSTQGDLTKTAWDSYLQSLDIFNRYPGITGVVYMEKVMQSELPAYIERLNQEYNGKIAGLNVFPEENKPEYCIIAYSMLNPSRDWTNAIGYDASSEARRLTAMRLATDLAQPVATERLPLVINPDNSDSFIVYLPLYHDGESFDSVEERRNGLRGFVALAFQIDAVVESVYAPYGALQLQELKIYDVTDTNGEKTESNLLYVRDGESQNGNSSNTLYIDFAHRKWSVDFTDPIDPEVEKQLEILNYLILIMVFLSSSASLLTLYSYFNIRRQRKELAQRKAPYQNQPLCASPSSHNIK